MKFVIVGLKSVPRPIAGDPSIVSETCALLIINQDIVETIFSKTCTKTRGTSNPACFIKPGIPWFSFSDMSKPDASPLIVENLYNPFACLDPESIKTGFDFKDIGKMSIILNIRDFQVALNPQVCCFLEPKEFLKRYLFPKPVYLQSIGYFYTWNVPKSLQWMNLLNIFSDVN